jgi:signal transduction histidine kinase
MIGVPITDLTALQLASVALHTTAAVVWGSVALREWRTCRLHRPRTPLFRLLRNLAIAGTVHFVAAVVVCLVPEPIARLSPPPGWLLAVHRVNDWSLLLVAPLAWHLTRYWGGEPDPPTRLQTAIAYGSAVAVVVTSLLHRQLLGAFADPLFEYVIVRNVYMLVVFGLAVRRMIQVARRGRWRPGAAANTIVGADIWLFGGGLALMAIVIGLVTLTGLPGRTSAGGFAIDAGVTILMTIPVAARELTFVLRGLAFTGGTLAATVVAFAGTRALATSLMGPDVAGLDAMTVLAIVAVVLPTQGALRRAIDWWTLRRRAHLWADLQTFLATLSPEAGIATCCRQALAELVRVLGLRGAAIILRDGESIVEGTFELGALETAWPRGAELDALPAQLVSFDYLDELPRSVIEALIASEVVAVMPITSRRRRWGALFATSGLLEPAPEENDAVEAFVSQLALLLDAAALLERTVDVERSLAHAEKLAAIGELAARIAHEIRNPVTAARSLAQLLARDPTAAENTEHAALILGELERVEAQVRGLLQFARREEYRLEPLDLGQLVRVTLDPMRRRLDEAEVTVVEELRPDVIVRGDREKLRQVLANLVDNALDALATTEADGRRLALALTTTNGTATLRVSDSGSGIPEQAHARLFEPFFSLKPSGTGLGLAIARRTVEAHGGRITAEPATPHGTTFRLDLPTA